jgi:hypothetical protein
LLGNKNMNKCSEKKYKGMSTNIQTFLYIPT